MTHFLICLCLSATATATTDIDAFWTEFTAKRAGIRTLAAQFSQDEIVPEDTWQTNGSLVYVNPRRILFRYEAPDPSYLIDGSRCYIHESDLKQLRVLELEDNPQTEALFLGFDDDTKRLKEAYHIELPDVAKEPEGARCLVLRPRATGEEAPFEKVTLFLRAEDYLPYRIHIQNEAESQVIIRVSDFIVNGPMPPEQSRLELPEGTDIIENDQKIETVGAGGKRVPEAAALLVLQQPASAEEKATP